MLLNRDITFTYLGHSTVLIESTDGKRILIDPWTTGNPACPEIWKSSSAIGHLDLILVTHIHNDHVGDLEVIAAANRETPVIGIYEACTWMGTKGITHTLPMNKGGSQSVVGVRITMTQAIHSSSFQEADGRVIYGGEAAGYILDFANGFTVYVAGDTALFGDMSLIKELYHPDLALLPIGDNFTMGPREAAYAVRLLGVRHVIPIHYRTFPLLTGTSEAFETCLHELQSSDPTLVAVSVHALEPGQTLR